LDVIKVGYISNDVYPSLNSLIAKEDEYFNTTGLPFSIWIY